jgi:ubiquinone/menaquinone biosynthesis C-methylase UbiE
MVGNPLNFNKLYLRLTYDMWRRILPTYVEANRGASVLECGVGPGHLLMFMEGWFPKHSLYGLDIDQKALQAASLRTRRTSLLIASAQTLPFDQEQFELVLSLHMIEHLPEPERFISEAVRVLRPGGVLALATPNPVGLGARLMGPGWSGWHPEHISLKPPEEWREILRNHRFSILRDGTTGLSGIPIFRRLPLALLNWGPLFLFGFFPWNHGEAYVCLARKESSTNISIR